MALPRPTSRSGETAKILILIGLILQGVEVALLLGAGLLLLVLPFIGVLVLGLGILGILWLALVYILSYSRASEGDYAGARTPTLVFGILSLLTFELISGILYIVAYAKLGAAEREVPARAPSWGTLPLTPGARYCAYCGKPTSTASSYCQSCGARVG